MARTRGEKTFPIPVDIGDKSGRGRSPVMGGSLTRSGDGQLQTLQTHGMYPTPQTVQDVWTNATRKRYLKAWEGEELADVGYKIEWEPRNVACGECGRSLGSYVGYRIRYPEWPPRPRAWDRGGHEPSLRNRHHSRARLGIAPLQRTASVLAGGRDRAPRRQDRRLLPLRWLQAGISAKSFNPW